MSIGLLVQADLINLDLREARDLNGDVFEDKLVQLEFQLAEVPLTLFAEAIDREPEQAPLGRICALKVLSPKYEGDRDPEFHRRFFLEASTAAKMSHAR